MGERIRSTLRSHPFLVFESDRGVAAYAYASPHGGRQAYGWSTNVSVYAESGSHRRGIGRALYLVLLGLLERQGFHSAFAGIALPNEKSVGLHEAMGFERLGVYREVGFKFGQWHDVGYWRRSLKGGLPDAGPIPFTQIGFETIEDA
jgi:phosphinothricin acetyltransferase